MEDFFEVHHRLIGKENQDSIAATKIAVVGVGGLGCVVAQQLIRLGVKQLTLIDADTVELSNLPRQVLFTQNDVGVAKVDVAKAQLHLFKNDCAIIRKKTHLDSKNAVSLLSESDIVVDCTDSYSSRFAISKACETLNLPMIFGGVDQYEGQVGVFHYKGSKPFHEVFPNLTTLLQQETCEASSVLPFVVNTIGSLQVAEVFKIIIDHDDVLNNALLCVNVLSGKQRILPLK